MPLNKTALKTSVKAAFIAALGTATTEQDTKIDQLAGAIADAVDAFVKTGTVTVQPGITLATPDTINGVTTGTGTGTIA